MSSLSTARTFGGIGSILVLLFIVPGIGALLSVIGWILILIAVDNIAGVVGERKIFNDTLIAAILAIVGIVVGVLVVLGSVLKFASRNGMTLLTGPHSLRDINSTAFSSGQLTGVGDLFVGAVIGLAIIWVFFIVSAVFLRRSFTSMASKLNVGMFGTAALLYLIGAALTIIVVGFIIVFIADILMVVAFFSMPDDTSLEPPPTPAVIPPPPSGTG
jgi:uncharacterized membrane protein